MAKLELVGVLGAFSAGKSEVAKRLVEQHEFRRLSMADPLKRGLMGMGADWEDVYGSRKNEFNPLFGQTNRFAMQTIGTEWGRRTMCEDIWVNLIRKYIEKALFKAGPTTVRFVIDDIRFANEAWMIEALGGRTITVTRPGTGPNLWGRTVIRNLPRRLHFLSGVHASERYWLTLPSDYAVSNHGSLEEFHSAVNDIYKEMFRL